MLLDHRTWRALALSLVLILVLVAAFYAIRFCVQHGNKTMVFISYKHENAIFAQQIQKELSANGYKVHLLVQPLFTIATCFSHLDAGQRSL
jgi:hypothetical protein